MRLPMAIIHNMNTDITTLCDAFDPVTKQMLKFIEDCIMR